jgi:hypothetical protein
LLKYLNEMKNERNAGRRKIIDGVQVQVRVTAKNVPTLKKFAKTLQVLEPRLKGKSNGIHSTKKTD